MKRIRVWHVAAALVLVLALLTGAGAVLLTSGWASRRIAHEAALLVEARFDGRVHVESLSMRLFPRVAISGKNLRITRADGAAPLLEIASFEVAGTPLELFRRAAT